MRVVGAVVGLMLGLSGCSMPMPTCGPSNCAEGCCTQAGACERGDGVTACGRGGNQCAACGMGMSCRASQCAITSATGGGAGGGMTSGAGGGATSTCSPATCAGCCNADGRCVQPPNNVFNSSCGANGVQCADCNATGTICNGMACVAATGGGSAGGGTAGGSTAGGGATAGGSAGGATAGGSSGGATAGGSAGGATAGGSSAGGSAGGSTAGGSAGGSTAGGVAGGSTAGGSAGGMPMPSDVTGSFTTRFRLADGGVVTGPIDVSSLTIAAHQNDGFTWSRVLGTGLANGTFTIPQVPAGPYVLQVDTDFYEAGAARQFPVVAEAFGRPTASPATIDPTTLSISLTGLQPWNTTGDGLNLWIPNQGALVAGYQAVFPPAPAANALTAVTSINWTLYSSLFGVGLVNGAQGDLVSALQTRQTVSGMARTSVVVAAGPIPLFSQTNGVTRSVSGVLSAPPSLLRGLQWNTGSFSSQLPAGATPTHRLQVVTYPVANVAEGYPVTTIDLSGNASAPTGVTIAHPFANVWAHWGSVSYAVGGTRVVPGTTSGSFLVAGMRRRDGIATFFPVVAATLGPVRNPVINGLPLTSAQTGVGLEPFVSWQAPSLGTPNRYQVQISQLGPNPNDPTETVIESAVTYHTTATGFRVPPGAMALGTRHVFEITAILDSATSYPTVALPPTIARAETFILSEVVVP